MSMTPPLPPDDRAPINSAIERVVVVGSGSAGRRHARALRAALPQAELVIVRRAESERAVGDLEDLHPELASSLGEALGGKRPTVAVVASPAPYHRPAAVSLAEVGAHLLVEKPLAADLTDGAAILEAAQTHRRTLVVGYHLRFGETVPELRNLVADGIVGRPRSFSLSVGQHLSQWRPDIDPSRSVSARRELGGGVLLELSHEFDGLRYLFGDVLEVTEAVLEHGGAPTDGEVETIADVRLTTRSGVAGDIHLDMVSHKPFRRWEIVGEEGTLSADLLAGRIELHGAVSQGRRLLFEAQRGERDRSEQRLIENLIDAVLSGAEPLCRGQDGIEVLALVAATFRCAESRRTQRLGAVTATAREGEARPRGVGQ